MNESTEEQLERLGLSLENHTFTFKFAHLNRLMDT